MSNRDILKSWIQDSLLLLQADKEEFFVQLWKKGKIHYDDATVMIDEVDQISSKLACSALDKKILSLLVFPDNSKHRSALTFTTLLVKYAVSCIDGGRRKKMLYFGFDLKFKHAVSSTFVGNLSVSKIFPYIQKSGNLANFTDNNELAFSECLPEVTCVISPVNPQEYIQNYQPDTVVIDCGRENEIEWLDGILKYCQKKNISAICWNSNCFSSVNNAIEANGGSIFYFPRVNRHSTGVDIASLYLDTHLYALKALLIVGNGVDLVERELYLAKTCIKKMRDKTNGNLRENSLRLAWRYIKVVENMVVPVNIYNSEVRLFWGAHALSDYATNLVEFQMQIQKTDTFFSEQLKQFLEHINNALKWMEASHPPFWRMLSNYCIDNNEGNGIRVIIFPTNYQKRLFSYTLLSKFNITEDELLLDCQVVLKTIKEYANVMLDASNLYGGKDMYPLIVGLPDTYNKIYFYELLSLPLKILIFPGQLVALRKLINEFNHIEKEHLRKSTKTLKRISGRLDDVHVPAKADRYTLLDEIEEYKITESLLNLNNEETTPLLNIGDLHTELAFLLDSNRQTDGHDLNVTPIVDFSLNNELNQVNENIFELTFAEGYKLHISESEQLNVIMRGKLESIYVKAISIGTKIMIIQNQSRQNLYDLILSRVHNHPSLEIHMAMLKKWKEELQFNYMVWKESNNGNCVNELLQLLRVKGSAVTSVLTIQNWLNGETLRPQDEMDMYRIGEVLNVKFIKDNYKRINAAAARIVGIHISLSRKLNDWIGKNAYQNNMDDMEIIDKELGLTFGELKSSIRMLTVKGISSFKSSYWLSNLGILEKIDNN